MELPGFDPGASSRFYCEQVCETPQSRMQFPRNAKLALFQMSML